MDITSSSLTIFRSEDLVIDFDKFLQLCVEYWILQSAADMVRENVTSVWVFVAHVRTFSVFPPRRFVSATFSSATRVPSING